MPESHPLFHHLAYFLAHKVFTESTELVSMHLIGFIPLLSLWYPIIPIGF